MCMPLKLSILFANMVTESVHLFGKTWHLQHCTNLNKKLLTKCFSCTDARSSSALLLALSSSWAISTLSPEVATASGVRPICTEDKSNQMCDQWSYHCCIQPTFFSERIDQSCVSLGCKLVCASRVESCLWIFLRAGLPVFFCSALDFFLLEVCLSNIAISVCKYHQRRGF